MESELRFRILGPLEVTRNGDDVEVGSRRQRALLTRLLVDAGRVVPTDRLIEALWGAQAPASASAQLQTYVSRLRRALDPSRRAGEASVVASEAAGYVLKAAPAQLDSARFEELAEEGHAALAEGRYEAAYDTLTEALALWRGDALGEFALESFADPAASRLEGLRLLVVEDRVDAALALGRHDAEAPTVEGLVATHPLRERIRGQLALALYRAGRQADALATLREGRAAMRDELGIDPSPRLRQLETQILRQDPELDWRPPAGRPQAEPESAAGTFLFTDIEGSTRLLQQLGEEVYSAAITAHDRLLREAFGRHGGREEDSQGDSFFFVFAHAGEAVRAAVEAQRALSAEQWPAGSRVAVRMGLHTGEASLIEGKFLGLAVHRAARVSEAANGGQILLSQATARLVGREEIRLRNLGEHRLKDLERPLELFQVVADGLETDFPPVRSLSGGVSFATTGRAAGGLTFTGRDRELGLLTDVLDEVLSGTGRIALVQGEPGIGKSRVALELAHVAAERGVPMVWGTCVESGAAPTLWPWIEIVRALVEPLGEDERAAIRPELAALLPGASSPPAPAADVDARFRLYEAVVELLVETATTRPLLVVLDDAHWADAPSLELLEALALRLVSSPILLFTTFRDEEPGSSPPLTALLASVGRYPWTRRVVLRGLPHEAVRQLIRDTAEIDPPGSLVDVVHSRTDGNPFFVAELVRLLAAESDLGAERVLYTGIPLGVRDVVRRRLQALPPATQEVLELAAAIGSETDFQLLALAAGGSPAECADRLEPALRIRVLVEAAEGRYRFSHGLVRETIVGDLTPLRRARLHLRVAEALLAGQGDADDAVEVVADHLWQARELVDPVEAVPVIERAADVALGRHAYAAADRLFERAIELARRLPPEGRDPTELRIELDLASLRMMTQGYTAPAVVAGFERAGAIARRSEMQIELIKSLHGTASALAVGGRFTESLEVGRQCLAAAVELGNPLGLLVGHLVVGTGHMHLGEITEARREFVACLDEYERLQHEPFQAFDLAVPVSLAGPVFAAIVEYLSGDEEKAGSLRDRAIAASEELGTPFAQQVAMFFCGWLAALEDDPEACRDYIERGQRAAGAHLFPVFAATSLVLLAWASGRLGDDGAAERLEGMLAGLETMGIRTLSHFFHGLSADLLARRGDAVAAVAAFEHAISVSESSGERFYLAELHRRRGDLLAALGRAEDARAALREAVALAAAQGAQRLEQRARTTLAAAG